MAAAVPTMAAPGVAPRGKTRTGVSSTGVATPAPYQMDGSGAVPSSVMGGSGAVPSSVMDGSGAVPSSVMDGSGTVPSSVAGVVWETPEWMCNGRVLNRVDPRVVPIESYVMTGQHMVGLTNV